jgi:hypothetical protein
LYTTNIDEQCLLLVVFPSKTGLGVVKYYSVATVARLARDLAIARERDPEGGLDLSEMNLANPEEIFRKKAG